MEKNQPHNPLLLNTMNIFYSLSFYSPIIICVSIVLFSMFTVTMNKAFVFFIWVSLITFLRIIVFKAWSNDVPMKEIPEICSTGLSEIFIPKDVLYSTYLLTFTMMYFMVPMFMISVQNNVNIINYGVLAFFICYIGIDIFIKNKLLCIPGNFSKNVFGNILSGMFLGGLIAGLIMYGTQLKVYLYINEINSNKEVCSMPSKQQFKCKVYKDGTLVGNM